MQEAEKQTPNEIDGRTVVGRVMLWPSGITAVIWLLAAKCLNDSTISHGFGVARIMNLLSLKARA